MITALITAAMCITFLQNNNNQEKEMKNEKQSAEMVNKLILLLITVSIVICIFLYIFGRFHFNIIFAAITSIMTIVHLGLLISTKKKIYIVPIGFYLFVALTFYFIFWEINPIIPAVIAGLFFILFLYVLISRKFA